MLFVDVHLNMVLELQNENDLQEVYDTKDDVKKAIMKQVKIAHFSPLRVDILHLKRSSFFIYFYFFDESW